MLKDSILYIVIPCYNEELVLRETTKRLKVKLNKMIAEKLIKKNSKVMYVNDGSTDNTWELIQKISREDSMFTGISLSKNRGHQNALVAGLMTAKEHADVIISMDADLQDDIEIIDQMIEKYNEGCEIVYGVRKARKKDTFYKRITAESFYKIMSKMGVDIVYNHADYRLTTKRIIDEFKKYKEVNLFLRGIFPLIGFKSDIVYYERTERFAGESKYPLKKMMEFAWDGITSFSTKPIRLIVTLGTLITSVSLVCMIIIIISSLLKHSALGTGSIISLISFFSGLQITCIGIVGEYVGKIYYETKERPRYIVEKNLLDEKTKKNT